MTATAAEHGPLTLHQRALLRFSARHGLAGTPAAAMVLAVWEAFGLGLRPYLQQLATAARHPDAEAAEPAEVRRLRRAHARRARWADAPRPIHPGGTA